MCFVGNVLYYQLNIDYIIETYCVNKEKPELQCNGKCHLAKQLSVTKTTDYSNSKLDASQIKKMIKHTKSEMEKAASNFSFIEAARLRDELIELEKLKNQKSYYF